MIGSGRDLLLISNLYLMKTIVTTGILSLLLFICMSATPVRSGKAATTIKKALPAASFSSFRTHPQGRGVTAAWSMSSNAGVTGFYVRKTYEDPNDEYANWETVYSCGCGSEKSYKCTDPNVSPGYITYQVVAVMADGSTVGSDLSTERKVAH